ncbi:MAG TPA: TlpA disulfide reductase family protein [Rhodocyclaceae bacterium]|nr:TlpA disulfide reductase family protein [Rhodocyclaceae bacterium]
MARLIRFVVLSLIAAASLLTASVQAAVEPGRRAPQLDVRLIDGTTLSRAELRNKVVLTVFWATWCPICMRELPEYQQLRDRHQAAGLEVLAISVDDEPGVVREYLQRSRLSIPIAMRTWQLKAAWGPVQGTPLLYLTDRAGVLRVRHLGAVELDALERQIASLLAEEPRSDDEADVRAPAPPVLP